jgi:phosphoribosyl 1,2-cyclic phosphate phosphodiesterase
MNSLKKVHKYNFEGKKILIRSIAVQHGHIESMSYIINNNCAYAPDINKINQNDLKYFKNLKFLIVDCLRYDPHPSHFNLDEVLKLVKIIKPKKTILTNLNYEIDYLQIKKKLPKSIVPAYDGMSFLI